MTSWKKIGNVGPPQGLNGSFFLVGDREMNPTNPAVVIGEDPSCGIPATIISKKLIQGQWVVKIRGVEGRKALEGVRGLSLWSEAGDENMDTLEGIEIVDASVSHLGKIIAVTNHGASDIVVIESAEKQLVDLPLIPEYFALPPSSDGKLVLIMPLSALVDLWYQ
jgi:ribosomal 30S subunit maturation factor RimM